VLRWAAYAAAAAAWRTVSPDHDYYVATNNRLGMKRARLSVGRRVLRRSYHLLFAVGATHHPDGNAIGIPRRAPSTTTTATRRSTTS
jgi:hypothetical protein